MMMTTRYISTMALL